MPDCRVTDDELKRFRRAFAPSRLPPFIVERNGKQGRRWVTERVAELSDSKIAAHLEGRYSVGSIPEVYAPALTIDIDNGPDLQARTGRALRAFPEALPLAFSTPSGGLHLVYPLAFPSWSDPVHRFAVDRLERAGVELRPGQVEVYPNGGRGIRAPLAPGCLLLDPHTLEPVAPDRQQCLYTLDELLREARFDPLEVPPRYGAAEQPQAGQEAPRRRLVRGQGEFMQRVAGWKAYGLTEPGQRWKALNELGWYAWVILRLDEPRVLDFLTGWMETRNNGQSRDWNTDPAGVRRGIQALVRAWKWEEVGGRPQEARKRPQDASEGVEALVSRSVASLSLEARERALYSRLLEYAHRRGEEALDGWLEVEVPSRTFKTWSWQYWRYLPRLEALGYVARGRRYCREAGRCNTYRVRRMEAL